MSARDENALEPVEPIKQSGAVLRVGRAMLTSGTGSDPVKTATDWWRAASAWTSTRRT